MPNAYRGRKAYVDGKIDRITSQTFTIYIQSGIYKQ